MVIPQHGPGDVSCQVFSRCLPVVVLEPKTWHSAGRVPASPHVCSLDAAAAASAPADPAFIKRRQICV